MADILDRLRKLHALSKSDNPHEAALAAQLAQQLMMQHHLEEFDLTQDQHRPQEPIQDYGSIEPERAGPRRIPGWQAGLADGVARSFDCRIYVKPGVAICIVGRRTDVEASRYTFLALARTVDRLANEAWNRERSPGADATRWKRAFRLGAVHSIEERLKAGRKEVTASIPRERALVLIRRDEAVDDWVDTNLNLASGRASTTLVRLDAFAAGKTAGHSVTLPGRSGPGLPAAPKRFGGE
jgi:hypothetical protein